MNTPTRHALLVLAHGSPDPAWTAPVEATAAAAARLDPTCDVRTAYLTDGEQGFSAAVRALVELGHRDIAIVAYFLSSGGRHVRRDIPALVAESQRERFPDVTLTLIPGALGEDPGVSAALAQAALDRAANSRS